jgi:hypothetical protein
MGKEDLHPIYGESELKSEAESIPVIGCDCFHCRWQTTPRWRQWLYDFTGNEWFLSRGLPRDLSA